LIASRRDQHQSKGLLKGFKLALRPWESLNIWWRYDQMKFVTNSSEFINSTMNKFCQWNGIIHETMLPYLPQQNGIAERAIAILFEMVKCILHSASLS